MRMKITCFMMSSLDGRIDCKMTEQLEGTKEYYDILESYNFDAYLSGKNTAYMHYAKKEIYSSKKDIKINEEKVFKGKLGDKYNIIVDTNGTLTWKNNLIEDLPIIMLLSENVSVDYLEYLRNLEISYIVTGENNINLCKAMKYLYKEFRVRNLGIVGGGKINAAFLDNNLLDEICILVAPGIDGRKNMTSLFDGLPEDRKPFKLKLKEINSYSNGCVLLKYQTKGR